MTDRYEQIEMDDDDGHLDCNWELASLADGSLEPLRARELSAAVEVSRALSDALAEQRLAVSLLSGLDVAAPSRLHSDVRRMIADAGNSRRRRMIAWVATRRLAVATALTAAIAAVVLAVALPFTAGAPSLAQAASLGLKAPNLPAPSRSSAAPDALTASVSGVAYPYWEDRFGWSAVGARNDSIKGRDVTTVFYRNPAGQMLAYSIVSGGALPWAEHQRWIKRSGVDFEILHGGGGRTVIVWERDGHTCVLSAKGVSVSEFAQLASWSKSPDVDPVV